MCVRERERDRQRDRESETDTETDTETDRDRERETEREGGRRGARLSRGRGTRIAVQRIWHIYDSQGLIPNTAHIRQSRPDSE